MKAMGKVIAAVRKAGPTADGGQIAALPVKAALAG